MKKQTGFTLIELVMVIVILGVLAVVAIPKYIDMKLSAQNAALQGVAGALSSAGAVNYAARSADSSKGSAVATCGATIALLQGAALPANYTIEATDAALAVGAGATVACTLTYTSGTTVLTTTFSAIGIA